MPITAKPAAVAFWNPTDKGKTTITWSSGVVAKVFRFVDGANETQFDGGNNGATGSHTLQDAILNWGTPTATSYAGPISQCRARERDRHHL